MNNKQPHVTFVYDRRKKATMSRPSSVEARITYGYKQKYISTGIMLYPNQWKNGKITNRSDIFQIRQILDKFLTDIRQVLLDMYNEGNIDIYLIPERLSKLNETITFIDFCNQRASIRKYGKTKDSQERYNRFIRMFTKWGKIQRFEDINEHNIIIYDEYLIEKGMKVYSKWNNYHRFLNSFIIDAIDEGYLKKNPYKWVNIEKGKESKGIEKCLTQEEFLKLKNAKMPTNCISRVRDLFIFQTYTCLSYTDLKNFNCNDIYVVKGMQVYIGKRAKTSKAFTVPLLDPALKILHIYNKVLPVISNVKYNQYLKIAAQAAGIDKPISSHWARHTGATLLLNEGIDMKIVSKICGHSSTRITEQVYAKLFDETVVDAIRRIKTSLPK